VIYANEMGSGAMTYILTFIKISSIFQKLLRQDIHTDTQACRHQGDLISLLQFVKIRKMD
jgi:hypothetical protein